MNRTYQFLVYADVNFLRENVNAILKNIEHTLIAVQYVRGRGEGKVVPVKTMKA